MTGIGSSPALATCETSHVLLAGVSGGFPGVLLFRPTYRLACLDMSEIILKGSDTNWAVQPKKMARGLKFQIQEEEGLYYQCSENKDADQLRGYRAADSAPLLSHMQKSGFLMTRVFFCQ